MKIISLCAENIKRLRAVEISPDGNLVEITGQNGQGKTSVLDAIWWALAGSKPIQSAPIRKGAESGHITLNLGEMIVRRTFGLKDEGEYTTTLSVESADGARYKKPQDILNGLLDSLTFDPLHFARMQAREQFDALRKFVPGFDFDDAEAKNRSDFAKRTDANRRAKEKRAGTASIQIPDDFQPIDETAILDALTEASTDNDRIAERKRRREAAGQDAARLIANANTLRQNAADLRRRADEDEAAAAKCDAEAFEINNKIAAAPPLPEPVDVADLRKHLDTARAHNATGARAEEKARLSREAHEAEAEAKALTEAMDERELAKRMAIERAELPVDGLGFGDGEILLNGVPFNQASDAEQLRASVAIAMAANSKLRVIRVRDGSLLDSKSMALLAELADANDCQVWIETIQSGRPAAIVIEDGAVAHATAAAAE